MMDIESASTYAAEVTTGWPDHRPPQRRGTRRVQQGASVLGATRRWEAHCEEEFAYLAHADPAALLRLVESGTLAPGLLTHAAEWAGRTDRPTTARRVLLPLLRSPSAMVREGAVYGLALTGRDPAVRAELLRLTTPHAEPSPGVRDAVAEALALLEG